MRVVKCYLYYPTLFLVMLSFLSPLAIANQLSADLFPWDRDILLQDENGGSISIKFTNKDDFIQEGKVTTFWKKNSKRSDATKQPKKMCFTLDQMPAVEEDSGNLLSDAGEIGPVLALAYTGRKLH